MAIKRAGDDGGPGASKNLRCSKWNKDHAQEDMDTNIFMYSAFYTSISNRFTKTTRGWSWLRSRTSTALQSRKRRGLNPKFGANQMCHILVIKMYNWNRFNLSMCIFLLMSSSTWCIEKMCLTSIARSLSFGPLAFFTFGLTHCTFFPSQW